MKSAEYKKHERAFMQHNYEEYLKQPLRIGFTKSFPEDRSKVIDEMTFIIKCLGQDTPIKVSYGRVTFGDNGEHTCDGITTERCEVPRIGIGSHTYEHEAASMELAVVQMAAKHDLMICQKVCSWPIAKAIVQHIKEVHIYSLEQKDN